MDAPLESDSPSSTNHNPNQSSIFLSSAVVRRLESNPLPTSRNSSDDSYYKHFVPKEVRVKRSGSDMSAALSRNITKILEALLQGYDKTERPAFKYG